MPQVFLLLLLLVGVSFAAPNEPSLIDPLLPSAHHFPVKPINQDWPHLQPKLPLVPEHPAPAPAAPQPPTEPATKEEPVKPAKDEPAKDEPAEDEPAKDEPAKDEPASPEDVQKDRLKCLKLVNKGTIANITAEPACAFVVKACEADYKRLCGERNGKKKILNRKMSMKCMRKHAKEVSPECVNAFVALLQSALSMTPCDTEFKDCPSKDSTSCPRKHATLSENCKNWLATNELGKRRSTYCWVLWVIVVLGLLAIYAKLRMDCMRKEAEAEAKQAQGGSIELIAHSPKQEELPSAWACESCTLQNAANDAFCTACGATKPSAKMAPFAMPLMAPAMPLMAATTRPTLYPAVYTDAVPAYSMPAYTPTLVQYPTLKPIQQ